MSPRSISRSIRHVRFLGDVSGKARVRVYCFSGCVRQYTSARVVYGVSGCQHRASSGALSTAGARQRMRPLDE